MGKYFLDGSIICAQGLNLSQPFMSIIENDPDSLKIFKAALAGGKKAFS